MRKLVIGCGYLGKRVAARWSAAGDDVFALTRSTERAHDFQKRGWNPLIGDVTRPHDFPSLPDANVVLYSLGFDSSAGQSRQSVTLEGLQFVLKQLQRRIGTLIFISTTSVYGQTDGSWVDEDSPCEPARENGQIALAAEQIVRDIFPQQHCILRLSGIYGPARLLARQQMLREGKPLSGNPDAWLNLIHVEDAVEAVLASEARKITGETLLISDDRPIHRREYYSHLANLIGAPAPVYQPLDPHDPDAHALNKRCRNSRMHAHLGLTLRFPTIDQGLPHALKDEVT